MYQGNFTEADRVIVESIFDRLQGSGKTLAKQAKTSDANMFAHNIFPKTFDKVAQKCYTEQMDAFARLFEDPELYNTVMEAIGKALYYKFKNGKDEKEENKSYHLGEEQANLPQAADNPLGFGDMP